MKADGRGKRKRQVTSKVINFLFRDCCGIEVIKAGKVWRLQLDGIWYYVRVSDTKEDDEKARYCYARSPRYFAKPGPAVWHPEYGYFSSTRDLGSRGYVTALYFLKHATDEQRENYGHEVRCALAVLGRNFRFRHGDAHVLNIMVRVFEDEDDLVYVRFIDLEFATYEGKDAAPGFLYDFHKATFGHAALCDYLGLPPQAWIADGWYDIVRALDVRHCPSLLVNMARMQSGYRVGADVILDVYNILGWVYFGSDISNCVVEYILALMFQEGLFRHDAIQLRDSKCRERCELERYHAVLACGA